MDIDGWVVLSDDGFLDFNQGGENQRFYAKRNSDPKSVHLDMNHFCTSPKSRRTTEEEPPSWNPPPKQLVHVPIQLEPRIGKVPDDVLVEPDTKDHVGDTMMVVPSATTEKKTKQSLIEDVVEGADQDTINSQIFFQINMKMDSPKSGNNRGLLFPSIDAGALKFEDKGTEILTSPRKKIEKEMFNIMDSDKEEGEEDSDGGGFNFWKWGFTGVGAIFSFGVAAATICVLYFGSQQRNKLHQEQKIRFQIYTDDQRIKQVVQHATKFNEAISAVRGTVPLNRAHITYGGYYDGL